MLVLLATTPTAATKCSSEPEGLTAVARLQSIVEDSTAYSLAILPGIRLGYERGYERHIYRRGYVRGFEHGYDFKLFKAACPFMDNAPAVCLSLFAFNANTGPVDGMPKPKVYYITRATVRQPPIWEPN